MPAERNNIFTRENSGHVSNMNKFLFQFYYRTKKSGCEGETLR